MSIEKYLINKTPEILERLGPGNTLYPPQTSDDKKRLNEFNKIMQDM